VVICDVLEMMSDDTADDDDDDDDGSSGSNDCDDVLCVKVLKPLDVKTKFYNTEV